MRYTIRDYDTLIFIIMLGVAVLAIGGSLL